MSMQHSERTVRPDNGEASGALEAASRNGETSFRRGLRVLLAFAGGSRCSMPDVARQLDLPLSTVYRYVRELRRFRLVEEIEPGGYSAGPALLGLALGNPLRELLRLHGEAMLRRLVARTGETAMLSIRADLSALVIAQVESPTPMRLSFMPGTLRPLHAGASALALLASETDTVIDQVLAGPRPRFTERTITDPATLRRHLAEIQEAGFVVTTGQVDAHATGIGVPVFVNGRLLCALSIVGPSVRFGEERIREVVELVRAEAERLGGSLSGGTPHS